MRKTPFIMIGLMVSLTLMTVVISGFYDKNTYLNIPYANKSAAQKLDIYVPSEGEGPFPVIISIHGGSYSHGDKMGTELECTKQGLKRGYAVVSINYRLSGEAIHPAQINDVKAAIRYVKANAEQFNLDSNKIALWGSSAGGGLASLAGTSSGVKELQDLSLGYADQSDNVQAVVSWCGCINFSTFDQQFEESGINAAEYQNHPDSFCSRLMGQDITEIPEEVQKVNPETYITPDDPPFYIQHGLADNLVPSQQSAELASKLKTVLGDRKVVFYEMPGEGHCSTGFTNSASVSKVLDFLDATLK